jgi:DtxR family Mn-dependent transcriptional regulator
MREEPDNRLSESMQMYLVTIARLAVDDQPLPLSRLAQELSISPISANEMCRKLQDDGLVVYRPYKGVSLTEEGQTRAGYVLRRHRLWEVFLVDKLGLDSETAHSAACDLEHNTPDVVADRLDVYLGHPTVNPLGEPVPSASGDIPERRLSALSALAAGQSGHVVRYDVDETTQSFLVDQGVKPGARFAVTAVASESLLIQVASAEISLSRSLADGIHVEPDSLEHS